MQPRIRSKFRIHRPQLFCVHFLLYSATRHPLWDFGTCSFRMFILNHSVRESHIALQYCVRYGDSTSLVKSDTDFLMVLFFSLRQGWSYSPGYLLDLASLLSVGVPVIHQDTCQTVPTEMSIY